MASIPSSGSLMATHNYHRSKSRARGGVESLGAHRISLARKKGAQQLWPAEEQSCQLLCLL